MWSKWHIQYIIVYVQDTNVDHEIKYGMKKIVLNKGLIYIRCHNNIKGKIENTYIL